MRKIISVILSGLVLSALTVVPQRAFATELYSSMPTETNPLVLDFESVYFDSDGGEYYSSTVAENMTSASNRGSLAQIVTEEDGNKAVRLTYRAGENYKANPALNIYDPEGKTKFVGESGKTYIISLSYKVENTDSQKMQLFIANCKRVPGLYSAGNPSMAGTDMNLENSSAMNTPNLWSKAIVESMPSKTTEYATARGEFVATGAEYPIIALVTNGKTQASTTQSFASVLIDNITVYEKPKVYTSVTIHNYDENGDKILKFENDATCSEIPAFFRDGYFFDGIYKDADFKTKVKADETIAANTEVYIKWIGDGSALSPKEISNPVTLTTGRDIMSSHITASLTNTEMNTSSILEAPTSCYYIKSKKADGEPILYSESQESVKLGNLGVTPINTTVLLYVEVSDYEKTGEKWGVAIDNGKLTVIQDGSTLNLDISSENNRFFYLEEDWVKSEIEKGTGVMKLPSKFHGFIKIDFSKLDFNGAFNVSNTFVFNELGLKFNAVGGACGDASFGSKIYLASTPLYGNEVSYSNAVYDISRGGNATTVLAIPARNGGEAFGINNTGTAGTQNAVFVNGETYALFESAPAVIGPCDGKTVESKGYMNTYKAGGFYMPMQPGVDTFMVYVEMPTYTGSLCGLKMLSPTILQNGVATTASFQNSIYRYRDIEESEWKTARAGADGELFEINTDFRGYIKFDIKHFKNYAKLTNVDFTKPYYITSIELGINNYGGENGNIAIGSFYSVLRDSDRMNLFNAVTGEELCASVIEGDANCDGKLTSKDLALTKHYISGLAAQGVQSKLRTDKLNKDGVFNLESISRLRSLLVNAVLPQNRPCAEHGYDIRNIFTPDVTSSNAEKLYDATMVTANVKTIEADTLLNSESRAKAFASEINTSKVTDFERVGDKMVHVSTFIYTKGNIYVSYYANTQSATEDPSYQVARFAYCPESDPSKKIILDVQAVGDDMYGKKITGVYDTIIMQKDDEPDNIYILWTASVNGQYCRLYRIFDTVSETMGEIGINRYKVGEATNDFTTSGIKNALKVNNIGYKQMYSDIGIMQKLSSRVENDEKYYYTGAYSGDFTCIIKSKDLITWEYVAQPNEGANNTGFENRTKWENAVYVLNDKAYYFVRQRNPSDGGDLYGILTYFDLVSGEWASPVLVGDCQSRSDFIYYRNNLYLFYAPTDRGHIGILKIDTENLTNTSVILQAEMNGSCFYPFVQYTSDNELAMSYTVDRRNIRLAKFTLSKYLGG